MIFQEGASPAAVHQLLSAFLEKDHLPRVSRLARLSANDEGDNETIPGLCTELLEFTLGLRKSPDKSTRRPSDEGYVTGHRFKWRPAPRRSKLHT
jgi:hypothetical protein